MLGVELDRNIGIATGKGLVVLDVDVKNGRRGKESLETFEKLPPTLIAKTPSGGLHYYFRCDDAICNTVGDLGDGLDTRGHHGFVIGPGSSTDVGEYAWIKGPDEAEPAPLPQDIRAELHTRRPHKKRVEVQAEPDQPSAISAAIGFLQETAPAIAFQGGNQQTYITACRLKERGLSEPRAIELLVEFYNPRCEPEWTYTEIERIVRNAYRYGQEAIGIRSAAVDFAEPDTEPDIDHLKPKPMLPFDPDSLPARDWIVKGVLLRRTLTMVIAPSGTGKTTWGLLFAAALTTGRGNIIGMDLKGKSRVWLYNAEDDRLELERRFGAVVKHHTVRWKTLESDEGDKGARLYINSGEQYTPSLAKRTADGRLVVGKDVAKIIEHIKTHEIDVLIVDPLQDLHEGEENSNPEMRFVAGILRRISWEAECAVICVHHTRKLDKATSQGHAGDMDSGRGASALQGVSRGWLTLYGMSAADASHHGIAEADRRKYVRLDLAKMQAVEGGWTKWFKHVSVPLGKMDVEHVGTLEPVALDTRRLHVEAGDLAEVFAWNDRQLSMSAVARRLSKMPAYAGYSETTMVNYLGSMLCEPLEVHNTRFTLQENDRKKATGSKTANAYWVIVKSKIDLTL